MKKRLLLLSVITVVFWGANFSFGQERLEDTSMGQQVMAYMKKDKKLAHLSASDLADVYLDKQSYSQNGEITHTYLYQSYRGIKIHNAISNAAIKNNQVVFFKDNFEAGIAGRVNAVSPAISSLEAIQNTAAHFKLEIKTTPQAISTSSFKTTYSDGGLSKELIPVELVYCKLPDGSLKLAWDLSIYTLDGQHWWSVRVDALDGAILEQNDWVIHCSFGDGHFHGNTLDHGETKIHNTFELFKPSTFFTDGAQYNVLALPAESPNHGSIQLVTEPSDDAASPFGWHDTNGVVGPEFTITRGNNVWAQDDLNANNGQGSSPSGSGALNFNFPLGTFEQQPLGYLDAATTNLFYVNNVMHDIWYHYGFDEASGNFQFNNYGNGGLADDAVLADAQDGGATNNANFATPPDGFNPRMQMFLFAANGPQGESLIVNGGTLNGNYIAANPSNEVGQDGVGNITRPTITPITGDLVVADDGTISSDEGCSPLINGVDVAGKIAVILRGSCNFTVKIQNAQDAGAIAVIVANHNNPDNDPNYRDYVNMYGVTNPMFTIPSIFINFTDGDALITALNGGETINATIFDAGPYQIDSSFDNGIVIHEYGHGITTRLTGGAGNSNCLNNNFQMGEGWSDWFALMLTMTASDSPTDGRGIGTYAIGEDTDGLGIRTRQYSTDFAINEYTFSATNDDRIIGTDPGSGDDIRLNEQVHYIGTRWATVLWDLTWAYIDKYGFDSNFYTGTGGNNRVMQVVIEGLKLQGCNPDFIDGRDGILAADTAITGGEDQCLIWEVFAKRGLGFAASGGDENVFNDQVEDFSMPDASDPTLANCNALSTETFDEVDYKIFPNPARDRITISASRNLGKVMMQLVDINGRVVLSQQADLSRNVDLNIGNLQSGLYILRLVGAFDTITHKIIKN